MKIVLSFPVLWAICLCRSIQTKHGDESPIKLLSFEDGQKEDYVQITGWVASQKADTVYGVRPGNGIGDVKTINSSNRLC